jgi:pilus assembly protein CpaB
MAAAGLALLLGGGLGLQHWFEARLQREREISTTAIVAARHALDQGSALGGFDWRMVNWPSESVPEGAILEASGLEGRVLSASLQQGEPIVIGKLAPVGAMTGLVQRLRPGRRALSVKVNEASGVNGFIQPGHRVDVLAHLPGQGSSSLGALARTEEAVSLTVLQDLLVLAVDRDASAEQAKPRQTAVVTLELTPQDAERLEHARNAGTVSLILRADGDHAPWSSRGETRASLRDGLNRVQAVLVPNPRSHSSPSATRSKHLAESGAAGASSGFEAAALPKGVATSGSAPAPGRAEVNRGPGGSGSEPATGGAAAGAGSAERHAPVHSPQTSREVSDLEAIAPAVATVAPTVVGSGRRATHSDARSARLESEGTAAPPLPDQGDKSTQSIWTTQTTQKTQTTQTPQTAKTTQTAKTPPPIETTQTAQAPLASQSLQAGQAPQSTQATQPTVGVGVVLPGTPQAVIAAGQIAVRKPRCIEVYDGDRRHQECLR